MCTATKKRVLHNCFYIKQIVFTKLNTDEGVVLYYTFGYVQGWLQNTVLLL